MVGADSSEKGVARLSRLEATTALHTAVIKHFQKASGWHALDDEERKGKLPPRLAIAGEAGLGKTEAVLAGCAKPEWQARRILYLVPSVELGEELAVRARAKGIRATVIRGRSQEDPASPGQKMCRKSDIADGVAALGYNVTETLCAGKDAEGEKVECPFRTTCPYVQQQAAAKKSPGLYIAAHAYLSLGLDALKEESLDLLIVDESFWPTLTRDGRVPIDRFLTSRTPGEKVARARKGERQVQADERTQELWAEHYMAVRAAETAIRNAIRDDRQPTLADFRAYGLSEGLCTAAMELEYSRLGRPEIDAGMDEKAQRDALAQAVQREAFGFARVWNVLKRELATERQGEPHGLIVEMGHLNRRSGELENVLHLAWSVEPKFQTLPLLVIDADADDLILSRFYPGVTVEHIRAAWQNVTVRQVTDRTGSKLAFSNPANQERAWQAALALADRHAETVAGDPARRPLVVAQKAVREAWEEEGRTPEAPFHVAHFGALRGKDEWKATTGVLIVGRIEPNPAEVERQMRAVFYADATPLTYLSADPETGRMTLPKRDGVIRTRSGATVTVPVSYHPDERADRIVRQVREAELMQAIARCRPVHRGADVPCEVLILTNVPLPIEVDEVTTWERAIPTRFEQMQLAGFLPDVASDCAAAYPHLWESGEAVRQAASRARRATGRATVESVTVSIEESLYGNGHAYPGLSRVIYRVEGSRRRRGAWVRVEAGEDAAALEIRLAGRLEGLHGLSIVSPLPDPVEAPDPAQEAAQEAEAVHAEIVRDLHASGEWTWWTPPGVARWPTRPSRGRSVPPPDPRDSMVNRSLT